MMRGRIAWIAGMIGAGAGGGCWQVVVPGQQVVRGDESGEVGGGEDTGSGDSAGGTSGQASSGPEGDVSTWGESGSTGSATTGDVSPEFACLLLNPEPECIPNFEHGKLVDTPECDADCTLPMCGDGHFNNESVETCDAGMPVVECRSECTYCGDELINGGEECDGGRLCSKQCTVTCGDGKIQQGSGEECDEGAENSDAADAFCSSKCERVGLLVFLTSATFSGDLGGIEGAHEKCSSMGVSIPEVGLAFSSREFRAWLSMSDGFSPSDSPIYDPLLNASGCGRAYFLPKYNDQRYRVMKSLADTVGVSQQLEHSISIDENGAKKTPSSVWTATNIDGSKSLPEGDCLNWNGGSAEVQVGNSWAVKDEWTDDTYLSCDNVLPLYCFEECT